MTTITYAVAKNINHKSGGGAPADVKDVIRNNAPVYMGRLYGLMTGVKVLQNRRTGDEMTCLLGEFRSESPDGTAGLESDRMFVYRALEEKLVSTFKSGGEKPVEFGYDITAVPDDKSSTNYSFSAKSIFATATSDRLNAISKTTAEAPRPGIAAAPPVADAPPADKKKK